MEEIIKSILLGIVQGLTEFLPVSSSGHLVAMEHFLGFDKPGVLFETLLHVGTLLAVFIYFRQDIASLIVSFFKWISGRGAPENAPNIISEKFHKDKKMIIAILIGTVPTGVMGILLKDWFEGLFSEIILVGVALLITSALLIVGESISKMRGSHKDMISAFDAFLVGVAQGIAIAPGISRSGATVATGLMRGIKAEEAVRFSFLLGIPAIIGATILQVKEIENLVAIGGLELTSYILGALSAMVTGYLSIGLFIKTAKSVKLRWFGAYCALAGLTVIIASLWGY